MKTQYSPLTKKSHVIFLMTVLSLLVVTVGYFYYRSEEKTIRQQKYNELKAIADLKVSQIEQWIYARNADVKVATRSTVGINEWLKDTGNVKLKQEIIEQLQPFQKEYGYENIFLATPNGRLLFSATAELEEFDTFAKQQIIEASKKGEILFTDFYRCQTDNKIHYDILAPIINDGKNTIAILLFRRDPNNYLYPLIQTWPTPSQSSETAILRVEQDSVVFLNELRHRKNTALKLKIPLTRTEVPSVQAALGRTGLFEGIDYRGVPVLSDIRIIPATNWIMLSKVDKSEIFSDLYVTAGVISGFSFLLIIICGVGFVFIYNSRQKNIIKELYNKEKELWQHQERFKATMESLGEGIITTDVNGKIQYLNTRAEELTGWHLREAKRRMLSEIYHVKNEETGQIENNILDKVLKHGIVKELANHTILISKSGKEIPVMDTGAPIYDTDGSVNGIVITFHDEAEKRTQQKLLKESEARLQEAQRIAKLGNWELDIQTMTPIWSLQTYHIHEVDPSVKPDLEGAINFYAPEARPIVTEAINRGIQEGTPWDLELPCITAKGNHIWVRAIGGAEFRDGKCVRLFGTFQDITERKRAEEELRSSQITYRGILDSVTEAIYLQDEEGKFLDVNRASELMYGYPREYFFGKTPEFLSAPDKNDFSKIAENIRKAYEGEPQLLEFWGLHKDGTIFPKDVRLSPGTYFGKKVVIAVARDITERKRAELLQNAVYRISQETDKTETLDDLYKSIHYIVKTVMRAENFYIALFDEEKDLISFPYFVDEVDVPSPPVKPGKGLTEYVLRTGKSLLCDEATDTRLSQQGEVELIGAPSAIWLGTPLIVDNKTIGVMVVQDYNDPNAYGESDLHMLEYVSSQVAKAIQHKRAEEKLRHSEEQFRLISENVADLIAVLDLEGRRVYSSPSYKNILGNPEALRGTDSFREIHPEDREKIKSIFQETIKTGIGQRAEYRFFKPDGKIVYIESQGSVIRDKDGKITNVVVVSRDVTEKKLLEQQFLRTQRLESIGTLAGGIAHDLNNVLAPILLSVEYLRKIIKDENGKRTLDALESSAKRGAEIIKQVLTFARGAEGKRGIIQLKHLMSEIVNVINETFPRSIRADLIMAKDLWTIEGDATNLHQVLLNLCVNARDAMPNGGTLKLAAENFEMDENLAKMHLDAKPGRYVILSVTDTGTGIPKEIIDKIYDPFFTTKAVGKGTGLGLSTVHAIIKSHGGFINVYSEAGNGTTFKAYLPVAELGQTEKSGSKGKELLTGNSELILVVDDEASILEITNEILETFGYRVLTAPNGVEALVIYKSRVKDIALVITDIMMPIMDGPQTIRELRKINPAVKIIASSGLMEKDDTDKGIKHIADGFIAKPYTAEKLLEVIHSILHKAT